MRGDILSACKGCCRTVACTRQVRMSEGGGGSPSGPASPNVSRAGDWDDAAAFAEIGTAAASGPRSARAFWRVAKSLQVLRAQVDAACPGRATASDGTIGDDAHCPGTSDHCPNSAGVVTALDLTQDPASGCDMQVLTDAIVAARDARVKYLIYNSRIVSSYPFAGQPAWVWRPYSGSNPHMRHAHILVLGDAALYDSEAAWSIGLAAPSTRYRGA